MLRRSAVGAGALLGAFHVWLLANQAWTGALSEPDLVLRWMAAGALACGLVALQRRGEALFGRRAIAIWVLAALLHGPALAHDLGATPSLPEAVATVVQITVSVLAVGLLALALVAMWQAAALVAPCFVARAWSLRGLDAGCDPGFLPRPPPRS